MAFCLLRITLLIASVSATCTAVAQQYYKPPSDTTVLADPPVASFGLGLGLDYGGIGSHLDLAVHRNVVLMLGLGLNLAGFGVNVGVAGRLLPGGRARPFVAAIYGYNAVIAVQDASEYSQTYYGPSFGFGTELKRKRDQRYWRFVLWLPVRDPSFDEDYNRLLSNPNIEMGPRPPDFAVTVGYQFAL